MSPGPGCGVIVAWSRRVTRRFARRATGTCSIGKCQRPKGRTSEVPGAAPSCGPPNVLIGEKRVHTEECCHVDVSFRESFVCDRRCRWDRVVRSPGPGA